MSFQCDICLNELNDKSHGTYFDQNQVLTSASFWTFLITEGTSAGRLNTEEHLGTFIFMFAHDDPKGYTVCKRCRDSLNKDIQSAKKRNIDFQSRSIPSGRVDKPAISAVAGNIWQIVHGSWPSCINRTPKKKWWQF